MGTFVSKWLYTIGLCKLYKIHWVQVSVDIYKVGLQEFHNAHWVHLWGHACSQRVYGKSISFTGYTLKPDMYTVVHWKAIIPTGFICEEMHIHRGAVEALQALLSTQWGQTCTQCSSANFTNLTVSYIECIMFTVSFSISISPTRYIVDSYINGGALAIPEAALGTYIKAMHVHIGNFPTLQT